MYEPDSLSLALAYVSLGAALVAFSYGRRKSRHFRTAAIAVTILFYALHGAGFIWSTGIDYLETVALAVLGLLALASVANYARLELGEEEAP
jgi:hypothetical membrane protein